MQQIPKVIHIIWIGDDTKRPNKNIQSWIDKNPTWTVRVWDNNDYHTFLWRNKAAMELLWDDSKFEAPRKSGIADMMRYEILYNEGGLYVDADSICLRPLEDWLFEYEAVACWENEVVRPGLISNAYIASAPKNPFFNYIIEKIQEDPTISNGPPWIKTGPKQFTDSLSEFNYTKLKIWPSHYFIPNHYAYKEYTGTDPVFARHEWGTTQLIFKSMKKTTLKICVYAISKNEEKFVQRFCESARGADLILIADTGSTDNTIAIAEDCGATVHKISIRPWRFDYARMASLSLIPDNYDICISLDLDELMVPGWREKIESIWINGVNRLRYKYDWGHGKTFYATKIHSRHGYLWKSMCHEMIFPDPRTTEVWAKLDEVLIVHKADPTKSRGQYLDLLAADVKDDPHSPRNAFYYGRELWYYKQYENSIRELDRYLALPGADWVNERCFAYRIKGQCYEQLGNHKEAQKMFRLALNEAAHTREPWVDLANYCYRNKKWSECYYAAVQAMAITHREFVYTEDPRSWSYTPFDLAALAAYNLGLYTEAVKYGEKAVEVAPNDERLKSNLDFYKKKI